MVITTTRKTILTAQARKICRTAAITPYINCRQNATGHYSLGHSKAGAVSLTIPAASIHSTVFTRVSSLHPGT